MNIEGKKFDINIKQIRIRFKFLNINNYFLKDKINLSQKLKEEINNIGYIGNRYLIWPIVNKRAMQ